MHDASSPDTRSDPPHAPDATASGEGAYAVLRNANFFRYLIGRFVAALGQQMLVAAIDWELFQRTGSPLALAFVGLSLMAPMLLCTLPAGHVADTFNRKTIILASTLVLAAASLGLMIVSALLLNVGWIYFFLVIIGVARTFLWPASAAFVPSLVPRHQFARAVTYNSGAFQFSCVAGPAICGLVILLSHQRAWPVYALNVLASAACFALVVPIRHDHKERPAEPVSIRSLIEGFRFVFHERIILGVITLDLFAVLLGGAVSLLPIYAVILHGGPGGYGLLRAAMAVGAVICAIILAHRPPLQKAGRSMLAAVSVFGVATILFGVANRNCLGPWIPLPDPVWFWFSFAMLALAGAVDNVSVVVRQTLVQILTPDEKRGRVSAVNSLFIGTSNEMGGFESGAVAELFGPAMGHSVQTGAIISAVSGGAGTILTVLAVAWIWPQIRRYGKLA
ncbi:MAG: MFS transporter [Verrucomicrobia bacterium]|nr:MFS transporter [Verrucomicrobiota bacterium]MDE3098806.1 MFS transporter [Verrucomicrobiota bacterium]